MEFDGVFDSALRCACGGGFDCDQVELHLLRTDFLSDKHSRPDECPALCESSAWRGEAVLPACLDLDEVEGAFSGSDDVQLVMCPCRQLRWSRVNPWSRSHRAQAFRPAARYAVSWSSVRRRKLSCFFEIFFHDQQRNEPFPGDCRRIVPCEVVRMVDDLLGLFKSDVVNRSSPPGRSSRPFTDVVVAGAQASSP